MPKDAPNMLSPAKLAQVQALIKANPQLKPLMEQALKLKERPATELTFMEKASATVFGGIKNAVVGVAIGALAFGGGTYVVDAIGGEELSGRVPKKEARDKDNTSIATKILADSIKRDPNNAIDHMKGLDPAKPEDMNELNTRIHGGEAPVPTRGEYALSRAKGSGMLSGLIGFATGLFGGKKAAEDERKVLVQLYDLINSPPQQESPRQQTAYNNLPANGMVPSPVPTMQSSAGMRLPT